MHRYTRFLVGNAVMVDRELDKRYCSPGPLTELQAVNVLWKIHYNNTNLKYCLLLMITAWSHQLLMNTEPVPYLFHKHI